MTWLLSTAAGVALATWLIDGIFFTGPSSGWEEVKHKILPLLLVSLILGVISSFVKPVVTFFSIPFIVLTLGLFLLVINALMIMLVSAVVKGFEVKGFWTAFFAGIFIAILSLLLDAALFGGGTLTTITAPHGTQV